jgi:hypothetical protein
LYDKAAERDEDTKIDVGSIYENEEEIVNKLDKVNYWYQNWSKMMLTF